MTTSDALRLQLLRWIAEQPRNYEETLRVWRTSCPRLSVWDDACADGLVTRYDAGRIALSAAGSAWLRNVTCE